MKTILIHHHLGLGDHISCNGLVRYLVEKMTNYDKLYLLVKSNYIDNIRFMYRDISNRLEIVELPNGYDENEYANKISKNFSNYLKVGFKNCKMPDFERSFYDQLNIPYNVRYEYFYIERSKEREDKIIEYFNVLDSKFALINTKWSAGNLEKKIDTKLPIINFKKLNDDLLFDWIGLIERASEIHTITTSFYTLVDQLKNSLNCKLYYICGRDNGFYDNNIDENRWIKY